MRITIRYVGLYVHKATVTIGVAKQGVADAELLVKKLPGLGARRLKPGSETTDYLRFLDL